ncbi:MAG: hypothetical protein ACAH11_09175, partial [Sphingomonas sp.]
GHPEGYIEAFANLYRSFARAVRTGKPDPNDWFPGIEDGLRTMTFVEAMIANNAGEAKWTALADILTARRAQS